METLKFDILKQFINARNPALGSLFDKYLATLTDHQIDFVYWAVEAFRGSAYIPELANPRADTKDLIDPYVLVQEPIRACKDSLARVYDPKAKYYIEQARGFPYQTFFRHVVPRNHRYDMKTGVYKRIHN